MSERERWDALVRLCAGCGRPIVGRRAGALYCSRRCAVRAAVSYYRLRVIRCGRASREVRCPECGELTIVGHADGRVRVLGKHRWSLLDPRTGRLLSLIVRCRRCGGVVRAALAGGAPPTAQHQTDSTGSAVSRRGRSCVGNTTGRNDA